MDNSRYIAEKSSDEIKREDAEAVEKVIFKKIKKVTDEAVKLNDFLENEENIVFFNPEDKAVMFDKPEMTYKEYFDAEIKNIITGLGFLDGSKVRREAVERYTMLSILIDKALDPEKFFRYSLNLISTYVFALEKISDQKKLQDELGYSLPSITKTILDFNLYKEKRKVEVSTEDLERIPNINSKLKKFPLPLIEI